MAKKATSAPKKGATGKGPAASVPASAKEPAQTAAQDMTAIISAEGSLSPAAGSPAGAFGVLPPQASPSDDDLEILERLQHEEEEEARLADEARLAAEAAPAAETARQPSPEIIAEAQQYQTPHMQSGGEVATSGFVFPQPPNLRR